MDPGLSMQRYWGSDDSDLSDSDQSANKLKQVLEQAKKRKRQYEKLSAPSVLTGSDKNVSAFEDTTPSFAHNPKKRRKKCSMDNNSFLSDAAPSSEMTPSEDPVVSHNLSPHKRKKTVNKNSSVTELNDNKLKVAPNTDEINDSNISQENSQVSGQTFRRKHKKRKGTRDTELQEPCDHDVHNVSEDEKVQVSDVKSSSDLTDKAKNANKDTGMFTIIGEVKAPKNVTVKRMLPDWLAKPTIISVDLDGRKSLLSELDYLDENVKNNLERLKITHLFPVQVEVVPWLMQSNLKRLCIPPSDVCVSAPTGSGKTLAFVLPIIQSLKERVVCQVRALVVLPVSDLALQVFKVFEQFCKGTDLHVGSVIGKKSFIQEKDSLVKKGVRGYHSLVDIVVATPGRLIDHISRTEGFTLEYLKYLVIDEADRMMEEIQQGFLKKLEKAIFKGVASSGCSCFSSSCSYKKTAVSPTSSCAYGHVSEPVQKLLYSATLSQDPEKLHELSLFQPKLFTSVAKTKPENGLELMTESNIIGNYTTPKGLVEQYVVCAPSVKPLIVSYLIHMKNYKRILCFTKSLESSHRLRLVLDNMGNIKVREMSSSLQPVQRKIILESFSSGKIDILVCTDMMARGIDIENVDCVVNYDAPMYIKNYVHRIGRTARAGREGCAMTLLENREVHKFLKMLSHSGKAPATPLEIDFESMKPMEEQYKAALSSVSKIIAEEKRKNFYLKSSVVSTNIKNEKFRNGTYKNSTVNGRFKNGAKITRNGRYGTGTQTSLNEKYRNSARKYKKSL